jgi:hypothetical protein
MAATKSSRNFHPHLRAQSDLINVSCGHARHEVDSNIKASLIPERKNMCTATVATLAIAATALALLDLLPRPMSWFSIAGVIRPLHRLSLWLG